MLFGKPQHRDCVALLLGGKVEPVVGRADSKLGPVGKASKPGGVGNIWGTLSGAFLLGVGNKFLEPYSGAVLAKIITLIFLIVFIQKKPKGMFALKGRAAEINQ